MVKVKLLESNSEGTYRKELVLACDRHYITSNGMWGRHLEVYVITRVTLSSKMESWGPKGIVGINRELRDYLRVGVFPIYGNGGFIVYISKGARMNSCLANRKRSGVRPFSDSSQALVNNLSLTRKLTMIKGARMYSSLITKEPIIKLDPNFISGFIDAEGCFVINILQNSKYKTK